MAEQVTGATKGLQGKVEQTTNGVLGKVEGWGNWIAAKGRALLDRVFPPEQRANFLAKLQAFMLRNPKISVGPPRDPIAVPTTTGARASECD